MTGTVVVGAGPVGLATAILLARDGWEVTVLERDRQAPPASPAEAWERWHRPGVTQFRQAHQMHPKFRHLLDAELPTVRDEIRASGGKQWNLTHALPASLADRTGRPGDERFDTITARRPVLESAFARVAEDTPGVKIVRGESVTGVVTGQSVCHGVPHVTGVRTASGAGIPTDLVVDAMGRRSRFGEWVTSIGGRPPYQESSDTGFAYYTRHYRSASGSLPEFRGMIGTHLSSFKILTVPADNDTWVVAVVAMAGDRVLKSLRTNEAWERVVRATPHAAHWIDAEPLHDVAPMAGVMDRYRRFVIEGQPVVTGMVAVGDAWACTNPTAGRGVSLGLAHAVALRDAVRANGDAPAVLATSFDQITERHLTPWYRDQVARDYQWAADIQAVIDGRRPAVPDDPAKKLQAALSAAANHDPDVARALLDVQSCIALPAEVMARPGMLDKLQPYLASPKTEVPGPTRTELVALLR